MSTAHPASVKSQRPWVKFWLKVEPIRWEKVCSKYLLKPRSDVISQSESQVQNYGLSTYLDRSLVEHWPNYVLKANWAFTRRIGSVKVKSKSEVAQCTGAGRHVSANVIVHSVSAATASVSTPWTVWAARPTLWTCTKHSVILQIASKSK